MTGEKNRNWSTFVFLALVFMAAFAYRATPAYDHLHKADAVVIGFMANDIATGTAFPLVYYGQHYMGSIEAWITALLFIVTGPTWWGLSFAPVVVSSLGVIAFYLLGKSAGGKYSGMAAAVLWAIPPFAVNFYNVTPRGCYPEVVCGGALVLWYATERWKGVKFGSAPSFMVGVLMGLLLWTSLLFVPFLAAAIFFAFLADWPKTLNRSNALLTTGLVVGAVPFIKMFTSSVNASVTGKADIGNISERFAAMRDTLISTIVPYPDMSPPLYMTALGWISLAIMTASVMALVVAAVYDVAQKRWRTGLLPIALFTLVFISMYLMNDKSLERQSRHFLPVYTSLVIGAAYIFSRLWKNKKFIGITLLGIVVLSGFLNNRFTFSILNEKRDGEREFIEKAVDDLARIGVKSVVWNDYERVHLLMYEALVDGEKLHAMSADGSRLTHATDMVEADPDAGIVISSHQEDLKRQLEACCGAEYKTDKFADGEIVHHIRPRKWPALSVSPAEWILADNQRGLGDRKFTTTMASDKSFTVELANPQPVTMIRAIYGGRQPKSASIKLSVDGVTWTEVSPASSPSIFVTTGSKLFLRAMPFEREWQEWNFTPVMAKYIKFDIKHPQGQDYDIHELFIYRKPGAAPEPEASTKMIRDAVNEAEVKTLAANRWVTASLKVDPKTRFKLIRPVLRPIYDRGLLTGKLKTSRGLSALVENSDARELSLARKAQIADGGVQQIGGYTLFSLKNFPDEIWWTGFTVIDY